MRRTKLNFGIKPVADPVAIISYSSTFNYKSSSSYLVQVLKYEVL